MTPTSVVFIELLVLAVLALLLVVRYRQQPPSVESSRSVPLRPAVIIREEPLESEKMREIRLAREVLEHHRRREELALRRRALFFSATPKSHAAVIRQWLDEDEASNQR